MAVDPELDELRREFLTEARQKASEIESALGSADQQSLERVAYVAHQLKGSGGSYGYELISSEAAAIEKMVEAASGGGDHAQIREHAQRLRQEIEQRAQELGA